ncbi:MAG: NUDIX hydrolase [Gammaproteobacteria bacterium]|nr:NUDIX hydrolase [Gammaproteobacteria bacterium]MDJ0891494.1 NUDIX hydrolase [Gammaproteobacteria bacterium]
MAEIPHHARCVFRGILFDVYQWEQDLFDGSTATFEAIKRIPSVQLIATTPDEHIVLLREEQPYVGSFVSLPGGQVERGMTPAEAARKELLEELGMACEELVLWREKVFSSAIHWASHDFVARRCRRVQAPQQEPGERIEPFLVTFDEFLEEADGTRFRNKRLADALFRMRHTPGELDKLKALIFG